MDSTDFINDSISDLNKYYEEFKEDLRYENLNKEFEKSLTYLIDNGGKRIRSLFLIRSAQISGIPKDIYLPFALGVEFFQTFTLIHDDLPSLDNDDYRRGVLALHKKYSESTAILAGDSLSILTFYLFSKSFNTEFENLKGLMLYNNFFSKEMGLNLINGQIEDIKLIHNKERYPNEGDLLNIYKNKTAKFFATVLCYGSIVQEEDYMDIYESGIEFGLAFQLLDDIEDQRKEADMFSYSSICGIKKAKEKYLFYREKCLKFFKHYDQILYEIIAAVLKDI